MSQNPIAGWSAQSIVTADPGGRAGAEVVTVSLEEGAAYGSALLAATGSGAYRTVEEACDANIKVTSRICPREAQKIYNSHYHLYGGFLSSSQANLQFNFALMVMKIKENRFFMYTPALAGIMAIPKNPVPAIIRP